MQNYVCEVNLPLGQTKEDYTLWRELNKKPSVTPGCPDYDIVCLQIHAMWWHEDELHGMIEVLDTPAGRLVRTLYCQGVMLGASSRGHSSMMSPAEGQQHRVVGTDLQLFA